MVLLKGIDKDGFVWLVQFYIVIVINVLILLFFKADFSLSCYCSLLCRYTNYGSRKARQISENPHASLLFYWDGLNRQVNDSC